MEIKSAAVPHFTRTNGKIVYAVRVCPARTTVDPYTVYRRWDEFQDFSARLSTAFPTAQADATSSFTAVPRLAKKVTLFVRTSTLSRRLEELDLFVRHLFSLPQKVTTSTLVKDFFAARPNGLDGMAPPSPSPSVSSPKFALTGDMSKLTPSPPSSPTPKTAFEVVTRPSLKYKGSTPDLSRFVFHSESEDDDEPESTPTPPYYPPTLDFKFPRSMTLDANSLTSSSASGSSLLTPKNSSLRLRNGSSNSPGGATSPSSDNCSLRTTSTAKPFRHDSFTSNTRSPTPMSFFSDDSEPKRKPRASTGPGVLKHFRSLQDIHFRSRSPHPPPTPKSTIPQEAPRIPARLVRQRSTSSSLLLTLSQVVEDEPITPEKPTRTLPRSPSTPAFVRKPSMLSLQPTTSSSTERAPSSLSRARSCSMSSTASQDSHTSDTVASFSWALSQSASSSSTPGMEYSSSTDSLTFVSDSSCLASPKSSTTPESPVVLASPVEVQVQEHAWPRHQDPLGLFGASSEEKHLPPVPMPLTMLSPDPLPMTPLSTPTRPRREHYVRTRTRSGASSVHLPTLETIIGSPSLEEEQSVTLKVVTDESIFLIKVPVTASLAAAKDKIAARCRQSGEFVPDYFALALQSNANNGTIRSTRSTRTLASMKSTTSLRSVPIHLEDEKDWQIAMSVATSKITLRLIA